MKVVDKKKALQDPYVAKNFRREAKLLQMIRHPNILQLFEVIETDSSFYLITELCSGKCSYGLYHGGICCWCYIATGLWQYQYCIPSHCQNVNSFSGGELMKYIYKKGQLDEDEVRKFMRQIVSAVEHMHRAGIIHR